MENELVRLAASQGLFAALFVALLFYVLKENAKREERLQSIIHELADGLEVLKDIESCIKCLKEGFEEIKDKMR
jgi:hypothetical protein